MQMTGDVELPLSVLKRREVEKRTGLSRSGLYELMAAGSFPKPIQLSIRAVGWLEHEIEGWIRGRMQLRLGEANRSVSCKPHDSGVSK